MGERPLFRQVANAALALAERRPARGAARLRALAAAAPDRDVQAALTTLIESCLAEARLSALGRTALLWDLRQRLYIIETFQLREAADPAIVGASLAPPLVVSGMPRSGTTFLHRLLAADPEAAAPRLWETLSPCPSPTGPDRRRAQAAWQIRGFNRLAPAVARMHPMDADTPQECTEITACVFRSLRFETLYDIPSYKAWLAAEGHEAAYEFHRRFLQHLQAGRGTPPGHWVLKSPDHVFALDALRRTYPGVRLVFLHRAPAAVLGSVACLTEALRAPFCRGTNRAAIGRQVLADWRRGANILVREAANPAVLHLNFAALTHAPLAAVARIYDHFGMALSPAAERAMEALVRAAPDGGYGDHPYDAGDFGISELEIACAFRNYMETFLQAS